MQSDWKGVALENLIRAQLAHFDDLIGNRIEIQGPSLTVSAHAAQTIGMVLHELATNAGKYGALSGQEGGVAISWSLECDAAGEAVFSMGWLERDGPPVSTPAKKGFGSTVIRDVAEMNLKGRVKLDFRAEGLCWRLSCPAREAVI